MPLTDRLPTGALRVFLRAPITLYRARLGGVFGHRLLYLAHQGRKTGRRREAVLEVVGYDSAVPEVFVVAGWGELSDWYRNITAAPALEVRLGRQCWPYPRHRLPTLAEKIRILKAYRDRHPRAWRRVAPTMGLPADPESAAAGERLRRIPAVAFSPAKES